MSYRVVENKSALIEGVPDEDEGALEALADVYEEEGDNARLGPKPLPALADCPTSRASPTCLWSRLRSTANAWRSSDAPHWKGLARLDLTRTSLRRDALSITKDLPRLRELDLTANENPEWALRYLPRSPDSTGLTTLRFRACGFRDGGIWTLAECELAPSLTTLDLSYNDVTSDDTLQLAEDGRSGELRRLELAGCQVGL